MQRNMTDGQAEEWTRITMLLSSYFRENANHVIKLVCYDHNAITDEQLELEEKYKKISRTRISR